MSTAAPHGVYVPPGTYQVDETSPADALRHTLNQAARAGEGFIDSIEFSVTEIGDECLVRCECWPVQWYQRRVLADALIAMATELLK